LKLSERYNIPVTSLSPAAFSLKNISPVFVSAVDVAVAFNLLLLIVANGCAVSGNR
jgi:hypothetical protein